MKSIAQLLEERLRENGATEAEVAAELGVDQGQVSRWRNGITVPSHANLVVVSEYLRIPPGKLAEVVEHSRRIRISHSSARQSMKQLLADKEQELQEALRTIEELRSRLSQDSV